MSNSRASTTTRSSTQLSPRRLTRDLGLKPDDRVFIRLRNTRFFDEDFSI